MPQATAEAMEDAKLQSLANLTKSPGEGIKKQSTLLYMITMDCDKVSFN